MEKLKSYAGRRERGTPRLRGTQKLPTSNTPRSRLAVSHGLQTASKPYATVTSAFYAHAKLLRSSAFAIFDYTEVTVSGVRKATYQDLASRVQTLSRHLAHNGIKEGHKIPLVATQGVEFIIGVLAVLSLGARFVLIDHGLKSDDYIRDTIAWCGSDVALSASPTVDRRLQRIVPELSLDRPIQIISIHAESRVGASSELLGTLDQAKANDVCYTAFIGGNLPSCFGKLKEVHVTHASLTNLVCLWPGSLGIQPGTRVGQMLSVGCEVAPWEIFGCLCNGGTLIIGRHDDDERPLEKVCLPREIANLRRCEADFSQIEVLITTPTILSTYQPQEMPHLRIAAVVGEPISHNLADQWADHVEACWICYGSPETTIAAAMSLHTGRNSTSVGCYGTSGFSPNCPTLTGRNGITSLGIPIPNTLLYVLDEQGRQRQWGQPGSIWVGGCAASNELAGYDVDSYRPDPFALDGSYMFRTGDLGTCKDGSIELIAPMPIDEYAESGQDLSNVEMQRLVSALRCAAGTSSVAALALGLRIHCFVVSEPGAEDVDVVRRMDEHVGVLWRNRGIPMEAHVFQVHLVQEIPVGHDGKLDVAGLYSVTRHATTTKPLPKPTKSIPEPSVTRPKPPGAVASVSKVAPQEGLSSLSRWNRAATTVSASLRKDDKAGR